jgi:hypothetical protein
MSDVFDATISCDEVRVTFPALQFYNDSEILQLFDIAKAAAAQNDNDDALSLICRCFGNLPCPAVASC